MSTLVVETGAGLADANSYVTVAEGDAFALDDLNASAWTGATSDQRRAALIQATRFLDREIEWYGVRATEGQALEWPRYGALDRGGYAIDSDALPADVKYATWALALTWLSADRRDEIVYGFSSLQVGSIQMSITPQTAPPILPPWVARALLPLGRARSLAGPLAVRLVRG